MSQEDGGRVAKLLIYKLKYDYWDYWSVKSVKSKNNVSLEENQQNTSREELKLVLQNVGVNSFNETHTFEDNKTLN